MMVKYSRTLLATLIVGALLAPGLALGAQYMLTVSEDTAPYSFVPSLARYNNDTLYAFTAQDENMLDHAFETYLRFPNLAGTIAPGEVVTSAELLLYYAFDFVGFGDTSALPGELRCHEITGAWNQTTLTWLNRPPIAATPSDTVTGILAFGIQSCDVTSVVSAWKQGTGIDNGLAVTSPTPRVIGIHSSEAAVGAFLKPTLIIDTVEAPPVPGLTLPGLVALVCALAGLGMARRRGRHAR